jgi:hypothetical protein
LCLEMAVGDAKPPTLECLRSAAGGLTRHRSRKSFLGSQARAAKRRITRSPSPRGGRRASETNTASRWPGP